MLRQPEDGTGHDVSWRRAHEVLSIAAPDPSRPDALLARAHGAQMDESQRFVRQAFSSPAEHAATMTVDAVPHDLAHEPPYLPEALHAVELRHTRRVLVAADFGDQFPRLRRNEVRFSR